MKPDRALVALVKWIRTRDGLKPFEYRFGRRLSPPEAHLGIVERYSEEVAGGPLIACHWYPWLVPHE